MQDFGKRIPHPLGLREATSLTVNGDVTFGSDVKVVGDVVVTSDVPMSVPDGTTLQ